MTTRGMPICRFLTDSLEQWMLIVTEFWKTDHLRTRTEIHVLPVHDRHTHALSRNTKHWTIDSQVCFYRRLFIGAVKPRGWHWGASIGLHGVPGCSSRQSWPPLCIVTVCATDWRYNTALWVWMVALARLRLPTRPRLPTPYKLNPWYYRSWKKTSEKPATFR